MTTAEIIEKIYGVKTYSDNGVENATITTVPTKIVSNNPGALQWTLINLGANDMYIWNNEDVSSNKGILIAANGGSYEINFKSYLRMPTYSWWGITLTGTTTVASLRECILGI